MGLPTLNAPEVAKLRAWRGEMRVASTRARCIGFGLWLLVGQLRGAGPPGGRHRSGATLGIDRLELRRRRKLGFRTASAALPCAALGFVDGRAPSGGRVISIREFTMGRHRAINRHIGWVP